MSSALLLLLSFAIVLAGAVLFTNGIEWLGLRLELGQGAIGSLLAAVATALPESVIPVVAVVRGGEGSHAVATGAILGAPFLLATLAMAIVGVSAFVYRERRPHGLRLDVHVPTVTRDLTFFLAVFSCVLALGLVGAPAPVRVAVAVVLVVAYVVYVRLTLTKGGEPLDEEALDPLVFDPTRRDPPGLIAVLAQLVVALGAIVGGAHLLVEELLDVADAAGVDPLVLSLVLAPLATELPEKLNSVIWSREGKDSLALGNITGAMVFQSTLPVAFALSFTSWKLGEYATVAGVLALAGAVVSIVVFQRRRRFTVDAVVLWGSLYATFVVFVLAS